MKVRDLIKYLVDCDLDASVVFFSKSKRKTWEDLKKEDIKSGQGILILRLDERLK